MAYELKPNEELQEMRKKEEEAKLYGSVAPDPAQDLPVYKDMGAVSASSSGVNSSSRRIIFLVIGLVILGLGIFGVIKVVNHMVNSGGKDISDYLSGSEADLARELNLTFEQHDERAPMIQQYSGGTVTVRSAGELEVIYINGKQVGVATEGRDYRFFGIGINDMGPKLESLITYKYEKVFVVMNDLTGGSSESRYFYNTNDNTCLVITLNNKTNRVVYMTYFTDFALISKDLSF